MHKPDKETDKERNERERIEYGVLGDIEVPPDEKAATPEKGSRDPFRPEEEEADEPMDGGSKHGASRHPGSREVTEGTSGNTGTEVGGTRNYRQGSGASGMDIGNRPE
ncbi:MAG TPA: hypothetical protein VHZ73_09355 [Vicinamibacterales bacterium]|jgi:hypothetical protein|nr:hypothetical protein [Vicinamibacterales bacterium]